MINKFIKSTLKSNRTLSAATLLDMRPKMQSFVTLASSAAVQRFKPFNSSHFIRPINRIIDIEANNSNQLPSYNETRLADAEAKAQKTITSDKFDISRKHYYTALDIYKSHLDLNGTIDTNKAKGSDLEKKPEYQIIEKSLAKLKGKLVKLLLNPVTQKEELVIASDLDLRSQAKLFFAGKDTGDGDKLASLMRIFKKELYKNITTEKLIVGFHHDELNHFKRDSWACKLYKSKSFVPDEIVKLTNTIVIPQLIHPTELSPLNIVSFSAGGRIAEMMCTETLNQLSESIGTGAIKVFFSKSRMLNIAMAPDHNIERSNLGTTLAIFSTGDLATKPSLQIAQEIFCSQDYQNNPYTLVKVVRTNDNTAKTMQGRDYMIVLGNNQLPVQIGNKVNMLGHHPVGYFQALQKTLPPELWQLCCNFNDLPKNELDEAMANAFKDAKIYTPGLFKQEESVIESGKDTLLENWAIQLEKESAVKAELATKAAQAKAGQDNSPSSETRSR